MGEQPLVGADGLPVADPDFDAKQKQAFFDFVTGDDLDADFDMYAADPGEWRDLSARIPGLLVTSAGGAAPFQSEGTLHGYPYYFRYRHGWAELQVMDPNVDEDEATLFEHLYGAGIKHGQDYDGFLDRTEFCDLMLTLVPQLKRAPFLWEFEGVKVNVTDTANPSEPRDEHGNRPKKQNPPDLRFTATDIPEFYRAWGATPQEAYARLHEVSAYLLSHGWTEANQHEMNRLKAINPTPVNHDDRVFPDPEPQFTVLAEPA